MLAEPAVQQTLLTLADLDSEVARVQHAARNLPQHKAIASLMEARKAVTDELIASNIEVDDLGVAVRKAEGDLVPVKARLERDQKRVEDGSISDPKTLRSLNDEVAHLTRRISELEDAQLEVMGASRRPPHTATRSRGRRPRSRPGCATRSRPATPPSRSCVRSRPIWSPPAPRSPRRSRPI